MAAKTAVVYFTRSGHSGRVAKQLSEGLRADLLELKDPRFGPGPLGYIRAAWHSLRQDGTLPPQDFPPLIDYETVVLCGPIWTSYPAVPLRALMRSRTGLPDRVALFLTCGRHSSVQKAFDAGSSDLGRAFVASASLGNKAQGAGEEAPILAAFFADIMEDAAHATRA